MQKHAFTLVELLVVIAIIGMLVGLLLPAVQQAREAARNMQCTNHLKNIGQACLTHESTHRVFPTGGWGWKWLGDPDRGSGWKQPGAAFYNILPFIEQMSLYQLTNSAGSDLAARAKTLGQTPLPLYSCPSRRAPALYSGGTSMIVGPNATAVSISPSAHTDYCENGGDAYFEHYIDEISYFLKSYTSANATEQNVQAIKQKCNGMFAQGGGVAFQEVRDGASNTLLMGEKYLNPDDYTTGADGGDNEGIYMGHDKDICRFAGTLPFQDRCGSAQVTSYGSAHSGGFNAAFADGSTRRISYSVDHQNFKYLCNRKDGKVVTLEP